MNFFKKFFWINKKRNEILREELIEKKHEQDYLLKEKGLKIILGEMHNIVGHAVIPFHVGGSVDMYYFLNHIEGTGFATMELLDPTGHGPKPNNIGTYELVAFTKELYNDSTESSTPFNSIERRICGTFTSIANYSFSAILNPNDTCELPKDEDEIRYIIFDNYQPGNNEFKVGERKHHLLLCIEVFKSELEFARENGSKELLKLLKQEGYYPYSDLNRKKII